MLYLASPYTHPDKAIREKRYRKICKIAAQLHNKFYVFSPIVQCHGMSVYGNLRGDIGFWLDYARHMISLCSTFMIATMKGWDHSLGIKAEYDIARQFKKPVMQVDPNSLIITEFKGSFKCVQGMTSTRQGELLL